MKFLSIVLLAATLVISCGKGPETVTVKSDPLVPTGNDISQSDTLLNAASDDSEFIQFTLGEFDTIHSLDPLFISNNSEARAVSLIYDRLVEINRLGNVQPAIAKRWEINRDSTRFTLYLRSDVYYHDSPAFNSGIGRKVVASDIKFLFERMASVQVPDKAAEMFKSIRGFQAYHNEQNMVRDASRRALTSIGGIEVRNDSTILFIMNRSSGNFIRNLAHPVASVYPKESVTGNRPVQQAAGTGRFYLVKKETNRHILAVNTDFRGTVPELNRLDIVSGLSSGDLFQEFAAKEIDVLPELSPEALEKAVSPDLSLQPSYAGKFTLTQTGINLHQFIYLNESAGRTGDAARLFSALSDSSSVLNPAFGQVSLTGLEDSVSADAGSVQDSFSFTQAQSIAGRHLVDMFATSAAAAGATISMNASYALSDDVTFTTEKMKGTRSMLHWQYPLLMLSHPEIGGIRMGPEAWDMDLSRISRSGGTE